MVATMSKPTNAKDLNELRKNIDEIDAAIVSLLLNA